MVIPAIYDQSQNQMPLYLAHHHEQQNLCPCDKNHDGCFIAQTAEEATQFVIDGGVFAEFTNPVTACAAAAADGGFELAFKTV